ncbi:MAG: trypsin-like peptidase domain-containing protein [Flavobacteriales bacterium]|nr:trypsin-like peptidase domain-containing protein [Flavobacteriales bacterium]MCB9166381.1 trypsin-like peptidase domain-containing protein [Flavobacteriales bacterium]
MKKSLSYFLAALLGGTISVWTYDMFRSDAGTRVIEHTPASSVRFTSMPANTGAALPVDLTDAAEHTVNAVVHVTTEAMVQRRDPFMDFFWGYRAPDPSPQVGVGSGVIISEDGYIVTNNHVVQNADKIRVSLNDKREFDAKVVGTDPSTDIALLKVPADGLPVLNYGNSDDVRVGQWVMAVGNPMNLTSTVTAGIVSAKARNINLLQYDPSRDIFPIESFIQTDAAVNPGNSGGALVNANGELIGINTAIASMTGQYAGYSFAVPVNIVKKVTGDLLEYGSVQRAYIGVSIRDMDQDLAAKEHMDRIMGVYVNGLSDGGAAAEAGVREGDVILRVGNIAVNNVPELQEQVSKFRPGDKVTITIERGGDEKVVDMVLKGRDGNVDLASRAREDRSNILGAQLAPADPTEMRDLKIDHGVKVIGLTGGKLRSSGIREGFIITRIDQRPVHKPEDIAQALANKRGGVLIEGVYPNGQRAYYGIGI